MEITTTINDKIKAKNVLVVEDLKPNILNVIQTCDQWNICTFHSEKCEIRKKDSWRLVGTVVGNSSNVYIIENEDQCYMSMIDQSWLWHKRMVHLNFHNLIMLSKKEVVRDLPKIVKPLKSICKHWQHGNQTKVSFKVKGHTTS